jgi:cellulose synthase/poly-beta-1,6-N-acetylglucosamine synthase-like glycosyltransferase
MIFQRPRVSIVIPLYDKADVLRDTLTCILSQTVQDFEAIVVDDGSTDEGGALVETARDPRFRLLRQANLGVSAARNRGILEAQAEWVALLDADDLWLSTHLADLVSAVQHAGVIGAFTNYIFESRGLLAVENGVPSQRVDDYFSFALANGGYPMHTSSVLFRREQLIDCGLFAVGKSMGEDIDMWCRLAFHGSFQYVARPSATYRDALDSSAVARNLRREAPFPVFAQRLPDMISDGEVPARLIPSARRYANFLLLEHARLLLDRGEHSRAREVLLQQCTLAWDPKRYLKRLLRTSLLGQWGFQLTRQMRAGE